VVVRFCRSCRCLILSEFRFCPYCGEPAPRGPDLREALDKPFARLEDAESAESVASIQDSHQDSPPSAAPGPFARAESDLARLEAEMDELLSSGRWRLAQAPGAEVRDRR